MMQLFGIRHHGPGSAHSLRQSLEAMQPDIVLIEGPSDANDVLAYVDHAQMEPPVALLLYAPEHLHHAAYYPFAVFSPEWQGIRYALEHQIPVRFIDLPQTHQLALKHKKATATADKSDLKRQDLTVHSVAHDPLLWLAHAAGYNDSEQWWNQCIEQRQDHTDLFTGLLDAMVTLRQEWEQTHPPNLENDRDRREAMREAHMRKMIRQAKKEGFEAIAIICGAWHTPALMEPFPKVKDDNALLKGLPKLKVKATWIPWSYGRLTMASGYGAGIESPGWYHHLWQHQKKAERKAEGRRQKAEGEEKAEGRRQKAENTSNSTLNISFTEKPQGSTMSSAIPKNSLTPQLLNSLTPKSKIQNPKSKISSPNAPTSPLISIHWLTTVAQLLRAENIDVSAGSVIEAVRLAEALAALRDRPLPGLPELNEAAQTVLCGGEDAPMQWIQQRLIVSDRLGQVPPDVPVIPLQHDLQRLQKRLRLKPTAEAKALVLDLRNETDLARSQLLHRLNLLHIQWGEPQATTGKGTFKEGWRLRWEPELAIAVVEAGRWGNTVASAAAACVIDQVQQSMTLPQLAQLLDRVLLANVGEAIAPLMTAIQNTATLSQNMLTLMGALLPLAKVVRYRDVRQTDAALVSPVIDGLVTRICLGLPQACRSLDDEAALQMDTALQHTHRAIKLLQVESYKTSWLQTLDHLSQQDKLHGRLAGRCCRMVLDEGRITSEETARRLGLALSLANEPFYAAAWVEGFLSGSGLLLIHDDQIWTVLDQWMSTLPEDTFIMVLPLLRRTFSGFSEPERRQMRDRLQSPHATLGTPVSEKVSTQTVNSERGSQTVAVVSRLLGLSI